MTYDLHRLDDALVVRWTATPTRETATALGVELEAALRDAKPPLALWIVIDTDRADPPAADARKVLQDKARLIFELSRSVDLVIVGDGIRASLMRTFLRTMALVSRTRDRMHVHDGVDHAVRGRSLDPRLLATLRGSA